MSELLRRWLAEDVGVPTSVGSFERDFASGFLFGEVLARCNLQGDFGKFVNKNTPDARINNFTRLQPTLWKLGVPLDARAVTSIVREEKGVAAKLLVHLKSVLDALIRDVERSKASSIGGLARSQTVPTRPTIAVLEQHRGVGMFNSKKLKHESVTTKIFNDLVRTKELAPNQMLETARLSQFYQEGERQRLEVETQIADRKQGLTEKAIDRRVNTVNNFNSVRQAKAVRTAAEYATHFEILEARRDAEKREIDVDLAVGAKTRVRHAEMKESEFSEAIDGIEVFERNLSRVGVAGRSYNSSIDVAAQIKTGIDPAAHLENMRASLPDPRALRQEGENLVKRIKATRQEEAVTRAERERRRRKLASDRDLAGSSAEARRREDELLETLAVRSKQETRVAERLRLLERERDVMRENRKDRDVRYEQQRKLDWEAQLRREAKLAAQQRAAYRLDAAASAADVDDLRTQCEIERRQDVRSFVKGTVADILALAMRCAEYREVTDKLVPRREYREWSSLVAKGETLPFALPRSETQVTEGDEQVTGGEKIVTQLDLLNAMDYCRGTGDWSTPGKLGDDLTPHDGGLGGREGTQSAADQETTEDTKADEENVDENLDTEGANAKEILPVDTSGAYSPNQALGSAVFQLTLAALVTNFRKPPPLPDSKFDARLAIVGAPFSGKTTAAKKVAETHGLVLITPDDLLREAVIEAQEWVHARRAETEAAETAEEAAAEADENGEEPSDPESAGDAAVAAADAEGDDAEAEGEETSTEPEEVPKPPTPSRVCALGLRALAASESGEKVHPSVIAELIAIAVHALAPPKPDPVVYPPAVDETSLDDDEEEEEGDETRGVAPDTPNDEATEEERAAYEILVSAYQKAKAANAAARLLKKKEKRQELADTLDATYEAQAHELEQMHPRPAGYVIDGFPCTKAEAQALEFAFTGLDPERELLIRKAVSEVAPPNAHEILSKSHTEYLSGLDGIITLNLPCLPDCQAATLRALGRRIDPATQITYHLDYDPPPEDEPGVCERLRLIEPVEKSKVEKRLHEWTFGNAEEDMSAWLDLFGTNSPGSLRVDVDAAVTTGEVFELVNQEVTRVLHAKVAAKAVARAADVAAVAAANAAIASAAVTLAGVTLEKAAKQLLVLRKAEIEAKALVAEAGEGGEGDEGETPPAAEEGKTKATPKPTATANALLAEKASEAVAQELVKARACASAAAQHAADAEAAWVQAKRAVADAEAAKGDSAATESARVLSELALARAIASGEAASESLRMAREASLSVDRTVAKADAAVAAVDAEDVEMAERMGEDGDGGVGAEGAAEGAEGEAGAEAAEAAEASEGAKQTSSPAIQNTPDFDEKILPIPPALAEAIFVRWRSAETTYVTGLRQVFCGLREERALCVAHFTETKNTYREFLKRPDTKMTILRNFQHEFNDIDLDHRRDVRTQGELLLRADELRDSLWDVCDERLAEATAEKDSLVADTWPHDHAKIAVNLYCALVQLELDKFAETPGFFADYFAGRRGEAMPEEDGDEGDEKEGEDAPEKQKIAAWFTPPPPVPDVLGSVASSGESVEGATIGMNKPTPPPPVPSPDDENLPEYVKALVRHAEVAPAAETGDDGAAGAAAASEEDTPVLTGPAAPALAGAIAAALAYIREVVPDEGEREGEGEGESDKTAEDESNSEEKFEKPRAPQETTAAMLLERGLLEQRLARIADRCLAHVLDIDAVARKCHKRLGDFLLTKYTHECGAIAALAEEVRVAAERGVPLVNDLLLEDGEDGEVPGSIPGGGDILVVVEEERNVLPPPLPKTPPPQDVTPTNPGVFTGVQFFNLCVAFVETAPTGVITPAECASLMHSLTTASGSVYTQLQTKYVQGDNTSSMPPAFTSAGRKKLANLARAFQFGDSPFMEWRSLLMSLLAAMFPRLLDADPKTIASAAAQLKAPAEAGKQVFAQARKLWFLPGGEDLVDEEEDTDWSSTMRATTTFSRRDSVAKKAAHKKSGDVVSAAVMRGLAEAFGFPGPNGVVDVTMLAMHLCVSATCEIGAGKAVEVARLLTDPERERRAKVRKEKEGLEKNAEGLGTKEATPEEEEEQTLPPMSTKEKRAWWCTAAGPGAMSDEAVKVLQKTDLEGKDVDLPAMAIAASAGGNAPLLGIATRKWFAKYGFKDCYEAVQM